MDLFTLTISGAGQQNKQAEMPCQDQTDPTHNTFYEKIHENEARQPLGLSLIWCLDDIWTKVDDILSIPDDILGKVDDISSKLDDIRGRAAE